MKASILGSPPGSEGLAERLGPLLKRLGPMLGCGSCTLSVLLTDDAGISDYNRRFRGKDEATDVLSFPSQAGSDKDQGHYLGDLVVSVERAALQAEEHCHALAEEAEILVLHGVLHLLGHDHEADQGEMGTLEARLARQLFGGLRGLTERTGDEPES